MITLNTKSECFLSPHILVLLNISCMIYLKCIIRRNLPTAVARYHAMIDLFSVVLSQEGRQASLAADFSITQFRYLGRLLMWHGRNR